MKSQSKVCIILYFFCQLFFSFDLEARKVEFVYTLPDSALINPGSVYSLNFYVITPTEGGLGERRKERLQGPNTKHSVTFNDAVHNAFIPSTINAYIRTEPGYPAIGFDAFFSQVGTIRMYVDGVETPHPISMEILPSIGGVPNMAAIGITFD